MTCESCNARPAPYIRCSRDEDGNMLTVRLCETCAAIVLTLAHCRAKAVAKARAGRGVEG